jgi:Tol biopolymer transport system component
VFVRNLEASTTTEVSLRPDGTSGTRNSSYATISGDGRHVAFLSEDRDLVPGADWLNVLSAYVRDLTTGATRRLPSGFVKGWVTISADGRHVAYMDSRDDIVPGDTNRAQDVFRFDLDTDEVVRVNVSSGGAEANGDSGYVPQGVPLSGDGRFVLFESSATNLVDGDTNARRDVFLRDTVAGATSRVSVDGAGPDPTSANYVGGISADGSTAVFTSELALETADTNSLSDIYLWRSN